jgi:NAD/NADP octopine/nopaline dehydrogenase-like protein
MDVLSELAAVPRGDATVEQGPECGGHALRLIPEDGEHRVRGAEVRRVARVDEVGIEWRAPALSLLLERVAKVVRERLDVDRRSSLQHKYVIEDVACGLVAMSELGRTAGVATPVIDGLITLTSAAT